MSRQSPDILPPCGGYSKPALAGCWQHYTSSSESQSVYINSTRVVDYSDGDPVAWDASGIPPYERPYSNRNGFCFCDGLPCPPGGDDCQVQNTLHVGNGNPSTDYPSTCSFLACGAVPPGAVDMITFPQSIYHNCYTKTTASVNLAECKRIGFKSLLASKVWQGRQSYTTRDQNAPLDGFDWCGNWCGIHNYDPDPDPTKYRSITGWSVATFDSLTTNISAHAEASCSVDRYSGLVTATNSSGSTGAWSDEDNALWAGYAMGLLSLGNSFGGYLLNIYSSILDWNWGMPTSISGGGNAWTLTWEFWGDPEDPAQAVLTIDLGAFTLTYYHETAMYDYPTDTWSKYTDTTIDVSYTATSVTYHEMNHGECPDEGPDFGTNNIWISCALSDAYTSSDVYGDWLDLISNYWNLGDEVQYPWRYRSYENNRTAPIVARDEVIGGVALGVESDRWDILCVNGSVVGNPTSMPTAPFWNGKHKMYQFFPMGCILEDPEPVWEFRGYGDWSGKYGIPNTATKWPDKVELYNDYNGMGIPEGAFLRFDGTVLWGAINAQIYVGAEGYNWARPCGALDRFMLDVNAVNCIDNIDGLTVNLSELQTNNMTGGNFTCSIWGTSTHDGVWFANGTGGTTVTLIRQIVSGSDMPPYAWGYADDTQFGNGMIAKNRWFGTTRPFCGHVDITSITKATPVTISLAEPQQGIVKDDTVIIRGCEGANGLNNRIWTLIPLGSPYTDFALSGSTTASFSTPYTGSGWIEIPFAPDWKWNSESSRQQYVIGTYDLDAENYLRRSGEYLRLQGQSASNAPQGEPPVYNNCLGDGYCSIGTMISAPDNVLPYFTQSCIEYNPCTPNVIAIMPLGQTSHSFIHVKKHNIKTDMVLDTKYGNWWQSWIIQTMPDPLYPGPTPCPCTAVYHEEDEEIIFDGYDCDCIWREDELCLGKQFPDEELGIQCEDYYAHHDRYEAVMQPPYGAPPLPPGISLTQSYVVPQIGSVNAAGMPSGLTYVPWYDYMLRENCVCADGRFAEYYRRNGFTCLEEDTPLL